MNLKDTTLQLLRSVGDDMGDVGGDISAVGDDNFSVAGDAVTGGGGDAPLGGDADEVGGDRRSKHRARKAASGLVRKTVWIPAGAAADLKAWVNRVARGNVPAPPSVAGDMDSEVNLIAGDLSDPLGAEASEIFFLRAEVTRLSEAVARASEGRDGLVPAGELEIALAELETARQAAGQAVRAREVQAANLGSEIARLKGALEAYKAASSKDVRPAIFGRAIYNVLRTLPGHEFDPARKCWVGPHEAEIRRHLFDASQAVPKATAYFEIVLAKAFRPRPVPLPRRRWWQLLLPGQFHAISRGTQK